MKNCLQNKSLHVTKIVYVSRDLALLVTDNRKRTPPRTQSESSLKSLVRKYILPAATYNVCWTNVRVKLYRFRENKQHWSNSTVRPRGGGRTPQGFTSPRTYLWFRAFNVFTILYEIRHDTIYEYINCVRRARTESRENMFVRGKM